MRKAFFTSASFAYLDRARVLFQTLRKFHPDWELWLCLVDEEPEGFSFDPSIERLDFVVRLQDLGIDNVLSWAFQHDVVELCTAVKGPMLCHMLSLGVDKVIYLDPDIAVFSALTEVESLLDSHDGVLTPHQIVPDSDISAIVDNEIGSLKYGIYNLGFLAVAGTEEGKRFARWWRDRLMHFCFDDVPSGLFTDQKWCNHAPVFFPGIATLRHPGYNVASWNLSQRPIEIALDGVITAAGSPLRFFHFTKITHVGELMIERYSGDRLAVFEILKWYKDRLRLNGTSVPSGWWHYGKYLNGTPITAADRNIHRVLRDQQRHLANPFASSTPLALLP
ncbi:hypothetical protein [Devosia sp. SL43]|uniref:hypothetical protein n=1 Tax=Devosia sp. SL43 TaxID=2806348 RepID=UPI001F349853|nr:hypothetical protein [Devosia sp. SL43]UJW85855.1 hypothetical protein IM737_00695 [Devosia sp. SL43]